jgi:hypothetical protein
VRTRAATAARVRFRLSCRAVLAASQRLTLVTTPSGRDEPPLHLTLAAWTDVGIEAGAVAVDRDRSRGLAAAEAVERRTAHEFYTRHRAGDEIAFNSRTLGSSGLGELRRVVLPAAHATSTGWAAGETYEDALERSLLEIAEREAFARMLRGTDPLWAVNDVGQVGADLERYRLGLRAFALGARAPIAVRMAVIADPTGLGPACSVGLSAATDPADALAGAVREALQVRMWCYWLSSARRTWPDGSAEARATFYATSDGARALDGWLAERTVRPGSERASRPDGPELLTLLHALADLDLDQADVGRPAVANLPVVYVHTEAETFPRPDLMTITTRTGPIPCLLA